jgi:hypothetical protein
VALEAGLRGAIEGMLTGQAEDLAGADGREQDDGIARAARSAKRTWAGVD